MKKITVATAFILLVGCIFPVFGCVSSIDDKCSYEITCVLTDGNVIEGNEKVTFFNDTENSVNQLKFNLFGNAFRSGAKYSPISPQYISSAYPHGINYGGMEISEVKVEGVNTEYFIEGEDRNILTVPLSEEVYPDEKVCVEIQFETVLANVVARTGYNDHTVNVANFYPILCVLDEDGFYECVYYASGDPFYSDVADYKVTLTANKKYTAAASGKLVKSAEDGDNRTCVYEIESARSFAFVLSEEFERITDNSTDVEINYYFYNDAFPDKSLEYAIKSVNLFTEKFGKYPYKTYSVVQTEFVQGGMEFPALVMISDDLEEKAYGEVIVHETAHQWWQTTVGNNEIKYGFLDESLAEYSVVVFYENYPEYGYTREFLIDSAYKTYKVFCTVYDKLYGKVDTSMLRTLAEYSSEYEYVNIAYVKGCIMFDTIRKTVGEDKFYKGLRKYYSDYTFLNATPYDLVGAFEKTGSDTNAFFDSFFQGKVIL